MKSIKQVSFGAILTLLIMALATLASAQEVPEAAVPSLRFDVAQDMSSVAFDETPVHEDGLPKHGNPFIIRGYLYPGGTLTGTNGVNPDGSPEFPEKIIGIWICRGVFLDEGLHATSGPVAISTQYFMFNEAFGGGMLVTEGYEVAGINVTVVRAITGGAGAYREARGESMMTTLGVNATQAFNFRFEFTLKVPGAMAAH